MLNATTVEQLAMAILELENHLRRSAMAESWDPVLRRGLLPLPAPQNASGQTTMGPSTSAGHPIRSAPVNTLEERLLLQIV